MLPAARTAFQALKLCSGLPQAGGTLSLWHGISTSPLHPSGARATPAFVFDIDGVLVRGQNVLPAAKEALRKLVASDGRWRYPVCFLTNGGGTLEATKAQQLSDWLDVRVSEPQVVLSHTPMRELAPRLGPRAVLVSGLGDVMAAAASYGFTNTLHTSQLGAAMPSATPFIRPAGAGPAPNRSCCGHSPACYAGPPSAEATAAAERVREQGWATERMPVEAVLVMHDPDDWYRDLQLLLDVVLHGGAPLAPSSTEVVPEGGRQVEVFFSNPDLLWAASFPHPRLGQGAFAAALQALHHRITGRPLPRVRSFGKPNPEPYRLIEKRLLDQAVQLGLVPPPTADSSPPTVNHSHLDGAGGSNQHQYPHQPFSAIFAVGDNPAADVRGANAAGDPWVSVLVRTGVFQGWQANSDTDPAQIVVEDVLAAVDAAFHRCREMRWHQHR